MFLGFLLVERATPLCSRWRVWPRAVFFLLAVCMGREGVSAILWLFRVLCYHAFVKGGVQPQLGLVCLFMGVFAVLVLDVILQLFMWRLPLRSMRSRLLRGTICETCFSVMAFWIWSFVLLPHVCATWLPCP